MMWTSTYSNGRSTNLFVLLTLVIYVVLQSFAINANASPADDIQELAFVNGFTEWTQFLGKDVFGLFRPIKNILFGILSLFDPTDVSYFRLLCIGIGILSFFPVLRFCRIVFEKDRIALLASAVWLLSPTLVSSTAWLSCVNIQIMTGFVAWALCKHEAGKLFSAAICLILACFSYESAVVVGPLIIAYDYFLRPDRFRMIRTWRNYAIYASVTLIYLLVRYCAGSVTSVNGSLAGVSRPELVLAAAYFTLQHFGIWFWPFGNMAVFGSYSTGQISVVGHVGCWIVVFFLIVLSFILRKCAPRFAFGVVMAFLAFLPTSNILGVGNGPYGDYYIDVASIGLSIAFVSVVIGLFSLSARFKKVSLAFGVALLLVRVCCIVEAACWAYLWADGERAYKATISTFPKAYYGYVVYAQFLCDRDDFEGALACCEKAERLIGEDKEKMRTVYIVRAICAIRGERNAEKALTLLDKCEKGCSHASILRSCHFYRGCVAEDLLNDMDIAKIEYEAAIPVKIGIADIRAVDRLARIFAVKGNASKAIELWKRALRISPGDFSVMWNLSIALKEVGDIEESDNLRHRAHSLMKSDMP